MTVRVPAEAKGFNEVLRSILRKFSKLISSLEFHNVTFDYETMPLLTTGSSRRVGSRWDAGRIVLKNVKLNDIPCEEFYSLLQYYGDRMIIQNWRRSMAYFTSIWSDKYLE